MSIEDTARDVTEFRLYTVALATLQVYDYWLTLSDEVRYAWKGRNWVFYLFLLNRYVPVIYQFWSLFVTFWVGYTQEMCDVTPGPCPEAYMFHSAVQVILTVRIYAITMKHKFITGCFLLAIASQLGLGIFMTYHAIKHPAYPVQVQSGFPDGHLCMFVEHRVEEIAFTVLSLFFDVGVFIVIMIRLLWRRPSSVRIPSIVRTIVKDATLYVLLLCTARIIFVSLSVFAPSLSHITRFSGNSVFVSIMVTRMLLSLKKSSDKEFFQNLGVDGNNEGTLVPPSSLRIVHGSAGFSSPASRIQVGNVIPIPMEMIRNRDERCDV